MAVYSLMKAYETLGSEKERRGMLKDVVYEPPNKRLGEKLSDRIYETFGLIFKPGSGI